MKNRQNLINALDLCADLFAFPQSDWCEKYLELGKFANGEFAESFDKFSNFRFKNLKMPNLEEITSNYISYFDLNSAKFGTSLLGGIWLDKKMFGATYDEICKFYESCGYEIKKDCDHISNLIAFCAILAENGEFDKFSRFCKFLSWFELLRKNLVNLPDLIHFEFILCVSEFIIEYLKEQK